MKHNRAIAAAFLILAMLFIGKPVFCQNDGNLYNLLKDKLAVNVYISGVNNSTGENKVDTVDFSQRLVNTLKSRKSMTFNIVKDKTAADIIISCNISKLYWLETDPIDMVMGSAAVIMDVCTSDNYAYMEVTFDVSDAKKSRLLWSKKLKIDLTKHIMTEQESIPLINEKAIKVFMRDCFSKKHRGKRE